MVCKQTIAGQWHHAVLAAQLGHRHPTFSPTQDRDDLRLCASMYQCICLSSFRISSFIVCSPLLSGGIAP